MGSSAFEIAETRRGGWARLSIAGELDAATAPALSSRFHALKAANTNVLVDLSQTDFIDCAGGHALARVVAQSRPDGWRVALEPTMSGQVRRFFGLIRDAGVSTCL